MIKNRNIANDAMIAEHKLNLGGSAGIKKLYVGTDGTQAYELAITQIDRADTFTTLAAAIAAATASRGDEIHLLPGHAETITTAIVNKIGLNIIGHGNGDMRPTLTINAAINGFNLTADDTKLYNLRIIAGASATAASRLMRIAASDIEAINCEFEMGYDMYHMISTLSGDNIEFNGCKMLNTVAANADTHPQVAILNHLATNVLVKNCVFNDAACPKKAERWRACVEGGGLASSLRVEDCTFICRGVATRTRSAAASDGAAGGAPTMATLFSRAISPSGNTGTGATFTPTCQYIIESYDVNAVNKVGVVTVTT
jgi:hypothetical protein